MMEIFEYIVLTVLFLTAVVPLIMGLIAYSKEDQTLRKHHSQGKKA
jgi:hypothetical protein